MPLKNSIKTKAEEIKLPYGLKDGKLVHISEVPSGLACGCVCPSCYTELEAHKGTSKKHHFQHHSKTSCKGALETALHLLAKQIIEESSSFLLPPVSVGLIKGKPPLKLVDARKIQIDRVWVEKAYKDIKPDLVVKAGKEIIALEIFVTHKVDEEKAAKIKQYGFPTIEIDLSNIDRDLPRDAVKQLVINGVDNKRWINSNYANKVLKQLPQLVKEAQQQVAAQQLTTPRYRRRYSRRNPRL